MQDPAVFSASKCFGWKCDNSHGWGVFEAICSSITDINENAAQCSCHYQNLTLHHSSMMTTETTRKFSIECILYRVAVKLSGQSFCKINALCCGWMLPYGALMSSPTTHMMTHNAPHLSFRMISTSEQCSFYHTAIEDNIKYSNPPVSL